MQFKNGGRTTVHSSLVCCSFVCCFKSINNFEFTNLDIAEHECKIKVEQNIFGVDVDAICKPGTLLWFSLQI